MMVAAVTAALVVVMYTYTVETSTLSLALQAMDTSRLFACDAVALEIVGTVVSGVKLAGVERTVV